MKIRDCEKSEAMPHLHVFFCPGCGCGHWFDDTRWTWNGDKDKPTVSPSILVRGTKPISDEVYAAWMKDHSLPLPTPAPTVCHSFVKDGRIQFLGDCTHELAGKTVDLEDF